MRGLCVGLAVAVASVMLFGTAWAEDIAPSPATRYSPDPTPMAADRDPCALFTPDATYVTHTIRMQLENRKVKMRVPVEYFEDRWDQQDGFEDTAQLFSVEIGTFLPVSRPETGRRNKQHIWNWMDFIVRDIKPLEEVAAMGATDWIRGNTRTKLSDFPRLPGPFGLVEIRSDGRQPDVGFRKDYFLAEAEGGKLEAFFTCSAPDGFINPGCQMLFRSNNMDTKASFRRAELSNWLKIKNDIDQFLACATSKNL